MTWPEILVQFALGFWLAVSAPASPNLPSQVPIPMPVIPPNAVLTRTIRITCADIGPPIAYLDAYATGGDPTDITLIVFGRLHGETREVPMVYFYYAPGVGGRLERLVSVRDGRVTEEEPAAFRLRYPTACDFLGLPASLMEH